MPTSPIIVQRVRSDGKINTFGYTSLTEIYANTISGDRVIYSGGDVDLASSGVQLKTGVKWLFLGNPTITSDAVAGTFYDNNSTVLVHFDGDLTITNSNGLASRIILQDASSVVNGFSWKYKVVIEQTGSGAPTIVRTHKNTLGGTPVWTRDQTGSYTATLAGAFPSTQTIVEMQYYDMAVTSTTKQFTVIDFSSNNVISIANLGAGGVTLEDEIVQLLMNVEVYP